MQHLQLQAQSHYTTFRPRPKNHQFFIKIPILEVGKNDRRVGKMIGGGGAGGGPEVL